MRREQGGADAGASARSHRSAARRRWRRRSSRRARGTARRSDTPGSSTTNSSPPHRPTTSDVRTAPRRRSAAATSAWSPASWPTVSLTTLNWSRSITIRHAVRRSRASRARTSVGPPFELGPVRQTRQRVGRRPPVQRAVVGEDPAEGEGGEHGTDGELGADQPALVRRQPHGRPRRRAHRPRPVLELDERRRRVQPRVADGVGAQQRLVRRPARAWPTCRRADRPSPAWPRRAACGHPGRRRRGRPPGASRPGSAATNTTGAG